MRTATLASALLCALVGPAAADTPEASLELGPGGLHATVTGVPHLPAASIVLRDATGPAIHPSDIVAYRDGTEPMALAIVYEGNEILLGNDDFELDDNARYTGILHALEAAIDGARLDHLYPAASRILAISYADAVQLEASGSPAELTGTRLGDQRHYRNRLGTNLVGGLELAISQLEQQDVPRRALIIIGDGNDTNNEAAAVALANLKKRAAMDRIETFSIIYKGALSDPESVISRMISRSRTIASAEALPSAFATIATQLADRFYVTFPIDSLARDGRAHELVLSLGADQLDPIAVVIPAAPSGPYFTWWRQLAIGGLLSSLFVVALFLRARLARVSSGEPR